MKTEIVSQDKNIVEAKAQFTPEEVTKAIEETYKRVSKSANIKGFRKGKVPRRTLELYFPKSAILAETLEEIIPDALDKMIEEFELKLIGDPDLKPGELTEGEPYEFTVKFEVTPDFDIPEISEIEAEKRIYAVTDDMIDAQIESILDARSEVVPTYEDRPVTKEDYASVKYNTYVTYEDGSEKKAEDGQKTEIFLGAETMRPEVVDAIVGKVPGDAVSIELPVDGEEAKKDKAVKSRYEIEIMGIMKKQRPELTDEYVAEFTNAQHKSVAELREEVKKQLEAGYEKKSADELKEDAMTKLTDKTEFEVPQSLVDRQKASIKKQQADKIEREEKMTMDQFFEKIGMDKEKYEADLEAAAARMVKRGLILDAIAEENNIEWTREELTDEIIQMAHMSGIDPKKLLDYVYGDKDRLFEMADKIRTRKATDFVAAAVKVKEVHPERIDLPTEPEAKEAE
ncbi:MAG: trigger factor [Cloacibacillus sp.]